MTAKNIPIQSHFGEVWRYKAASEWWNVTLMAISCDSDDWLTKGIVLQADRPGMHQEGAPISVYLNLHWTRENK